MTSELNQAEVAAAATKAVCAAAIAAGFYEAGYQAVAEQPGAFLVYLDDTREGAAVIEIAGSSDQGAVVSVTRADDQVEIVRTTLGDLTRIALEVAQRTMSVEAEAANTNRPHPDCGTLVMMSVALGDTRPAAAWVSADHSVRVPMAGTVSEAAERIQKTRGPTAGRDANGNPVPGLVEGYIVVGDFRR